MIFLSEAELEVLRVQPVFQDSSGNLDIIMRDSNAFRSLAAFQAASMYECEENQQKTQENMSIDSYLYEDVDADELDAACNNLNKQMRDLHSLFMNENPEVNSFVSLSSNLINEIMEYSNEIRSKLENSKLHLSKQSLRYLDRRAIALMNLLANTAENIFSIQKLKYLAEEHTPKSGCKAFLNVLCSLFSLNYVNGDVSTFMQLFLEDVNIIHKYLSVLNEFSILNKSLHKLKNKFYSAGKKDDAVIKALDRIMGYFKAFVINTLFEDSWLLKSNIYMNQLLAKGFLRSSLFKAYNNELFKIFMSIDLESRIDRSALSKILTNRDKAKKAIKRLEENSLLHLLATKEFKKEVCDIEEIERKAKNILRDGNKEQLSVLQIHFNALEIQKNLYVDIKRVLIFMSLSVKEIMPLINGVRNAHLPFKGPISDYSYAAKIPLEEYALIYKILDLHSDILSISFQYEDELKKRVSDLKELEQPESLDFNDDAQRILSSHYFNVTRTFKSMLTLLSDLVFYHSYCTEINNELQN